MDKNSKSFKKKSIDKLSDKSVIKPTKEKKIDEKELMRIRKRAELNEKRARRKKILINAIKYLSNNSISVDEYVHKDVFPKKPFQLRGSEEFFDAVKFNDIKVVKEALAKNEHYLIQFDYFKQTPLHWAAKLGYHEILILLLFKYIILYFLI